MDALIIATCIFVPLFVLNLLAAGRDQLLFQTRPKASRWFTATAMLATTAVLLRLGMPLSWALALVLPGPLASVLGDWIGSGNWVVLRHRLGRSPGQGD
jgi:hypothetical protein